ncbi:MAG TPA: transketolase C-terminal domain-containing protein [Burkholderiales bacterium]|nr:transketolase C-terminal domain-containing protein [Burkholderiales bacterium]
MRNAFADEITSLGAKDSRVVLLSGDIGNKLFDKFKEKAPGRFFNCGVAEANMMGVAAGMALSGLRPVVYTITPFTTTRCFEQIRVDVCYHKAPVIIVGTGSGLSYADLGPTHHSCEDLAILRTLPEMTVMAPGDSLELRAALQAALRHDGPVYMRIGKKGEPQIHSEISKLEIGRALTIQDGKDVCLVSTGVMLSVVMDAAKRLAEQKISARVESFPTVKPLDVRRLAEIFGQYPVVAVAEEHGRIGGLAGAVAEWLAGQDKPRAKLLSFGTADEFMHEVGTTEYARRKWGLTAENIAREVAAHADRR